MRKLIYLRRLTLPCSHSQTSRIKGRECGELLIAKIITVPPEQLSILDEDGLSHISHYILGPYTEGTSLNLTCVAAGGKCMTCRCTFIAFASHNARASRLVASTRSTRVARFTRNKCAARFLWHFSQTHYSWCRVLNFEQWRRRLLRHGEKYKYMRIIKVKTASA